VCVDGVDSRCAGGENDLRAGSQHLCPFVGPQCADIAGQVLGPEQKCVRRLASGDLLGVEDTRSRFNERKDRQVDIAIPELRRQRLDSRPGVGFREHDAIRARIGAQHTIEVLPSDVGRGVDPETDLTVGIDRSKRLFHRRSSRSFRVWGDAVFEIEDHGVSPHLHGLSLHGSTIARREQDAPSDHIRS